MKPSEASAIVTYLEAAFDKEISEATREVYIATLADLDLDAGLVAAKEIVRTSKWFPSVAEICIAVVDRDSGLPAPDEAWAQAVTLACSRPLDGIAYGQPEGIHPVVVAVAQAIGLDNIGNSSTENTYMQNHFVKMYEARSKRVLHDANVLPMLERGDMDAGIARLVDGIGELPEDGE